MMQMPNKMSISQAAQAEMKMARISSKIDDLRLGLEDKSLTNDEIKRIVDTIFEELRA